jgi:hypothetical protein
MKKLSTLRNSFLVRLSVVLLAIMPMVSIAQVDIIDQELRDGSLPSGWTQTNVSFSTSAGGFANLTGLTAVLTTPVIDITGYTGVTLTFSVAKFGSGSDGPVTVQFSNDGGTTWTAQSFNSPTPSSATYLTSGPTTITATGSTVRFRFITTGSQSAKRLRDVVLNGTAPTGPADPTTTSISPTSTTAGSGAFTLTVNGTNFLDGSSTVRWNGSARTTTFVSATQLTAAIDAADVLNVGTADVTVLTTGAANESNAQTFTISPPDPTTTSISPTSATAGGGGFTLTVNGTNFFSGLSTVRWNGTTRSTTFVNSTQLTATINAGDIATAGSATVDVVTTGAANASNTQTFTIDAATNTQVGFATTTSSIAENLGPASIAITITNPDPVVSTSVTVTASGATGRIGTFTSPVVAAGAASSVDLVVPIDNNILCDGNENVVFTITAVSGGNSATIGTNNVHTLTVQNEDACTGLSFAATSATIGEAAGTYDVVVNITDPSGSVATSVDVVLTDGNGARIDGFTTETVTFTAGSSTPQTVSLTITNDILCNGTGVLTFELDNLTGGQNTTFIGPNSSRTLTITDNDAAVAPVATAATEVGLDEFTATWEPVAGATGYALDVYSIAGTTDDFSNGNFSAAPTWSGSTGNYAVLTDATVPGGAATTDGFFLASNESVGASALYTASEQVREWKFSWASTSFGTSSANYFGVVLMADAPFTTIADAFNGYFLRIGTGGSTDPVELWRSTGAVKAKVGDFTTPNYDGSALTNGINVRVTRSLSGEFQFFYGTGFTFATVPVTNGGTLTDATHSTSSYFGVYTAFDNPSASRRVYLDNVDLQSTVYELENEILGNVTEYDVVGLDVNTTYYYVVRAEVGGGCGLSSNSNEIEVTTLANTSVEFVVTGATVSEGVATYDVTVNISDFSATTATTVDVVLTDGDGTRINGFATQEVEFDANDGTPQTVTLTVTDNELCDGNEVLTFELQNIAGGQGTPFIGVVGTRTLTIEDDEVAEDPLALDGDEETYDGFTANWEEIIGATEYFLDVSTSPTFGNFSAGASTTETFTAVGGGTSSSYSTRAWTGVDGVSWTAYKARTDQVITSSNDAITLENAANAYLISGDIAGGVRSISFETKRIFGSVNGELTVKVLSGPGFTTETTIGTIVYTPTTATFSQSFTDIQGPIRIRVDNNAAARPIIDNLTFARADVNEPSFVSGYEDLSVGDVLTFDVTGLDPLTTYYYRVRSTGGCSTGDNSNTISVNTTAVTTYYSRNTGNVNAAIWATSPNGTAGNAVWTAASDMVIQTGHTVTVNASTSIDDLTLQSGATLTIDTERLLSVYGTSVDLTGTVTNATGEIELVSTSPTTLTLTGTVGVNDLTVANAAGVTATGALDVHGTLTLAVGDFDATAATVRLRSTATRTGRLGTVGASASYTGNLNAQRFIPPGATNWRLLGSPVQSRTVADWNDDFITAGFPGSDYPNFDQPVGSGILWPSVRWYNETNTGTNLNDGIVGVTSMAQTLTEGQGFAVWCGDQFGSTAAFTIDVIGEPTIAQSQSPITLPMSYTETSTPTVDGWNLVSNPLPSPIAFASISRGADVQNGYYVYDPVTGSTAYWNGAAQTSTPEDALNGVIQSSQAFWLKASGSAVTTTVDEQDKVAGNVGGLFGGDGDAIIPLVRLTMRGATGTWSDQAAILFQDGNPALDGSDALKIDFSHPSAPRIATRTTDGHDLIFNSFGTHNSAISIPVTVRVPANGTYTITTTMAGLQGLSCFTLVDLLTGTTTPMTDGAVYTFTMNGTANVVTDRFVLNATTPIAFAATDAVCGGTATGAVAVQLTEQTDLLTLADAFGNPIQVATNVPMGEHIFGGLVAGNYTVIAGSSSACGTLSAPVVVAEPFALEAAIETSPSTCGSEADGSAALGILGGEAPYGILWSTGSTEESITGVAGEYSVVVTDASGCTLNVEVAIPAGPGPEALFETTAEPILVNELIEFMNMSTTEAVEYTWDFGDGTTSSDFNATHSYTLPGTYTVTLTVSDGVCSAVYTQEITVQLTTSVTAPVKPADQVNAWVAGDMIVVEHGFDHGRPVHIAVLDATGKLHLQEQVSGTPGRVQLSATTLSTGIWFVRVTSDPVQRTIRVPVLR